MRGQFAQWLSLWKETRAQRQLEATLTLAGEPHLVAAARERFFARDAVPGVWNGSVSELDRFISDSSELLIVFVEARHEEAATRMLARSHPQGGAVLAVDEGPVATGRARYVALRCQRLSFADTPRGWERLFEAVAEVGGDRAVALGRRYPVLRSAVARSVIERAALENGLLGLAVFLPGADLPLMTRNQARMVLTLAALYGENVDLDRIPELALVLAGGVSFRAVARALSRLLPGVGALVKGGTGYAGTLALGWAAARYFEHGAPLAASRLLPALAKLPER